MNRRIPRYFYDIDTTIKFLSFTLLFVILFFLIYSPFGLAIWVRDDRTYNFIIACIISLCAFGVLVFTRMLFSQICKKLPVTYLQYVLWAFAEVLFIALLYTTFSKIILHDERLFMHLLGRSSFIIVLMLIIPYALSTLYFNLIDKQKQLKRYRAKKKKELEKATINVETDTTDLIHFRDENQVLRLTIVLEKLFYIESHVNYVMIYYEQNNEIVNFQLRSSLKSIENQDFSPQLVRCHRSFMVNFNKIAIFRKAKEGTFLQFEYPNLPEIPVSKSYLENITNKFKNTK